MAVSEAVVNIEHRAAPDLRSWQLGTLQLECGAVLEEVDVSYATLGTLSPAKDNVVWICHTLTANQDPSAWWPGLVGPGKLVDPIRHFVVCANVLGSCYGTTGPATLRPGSDTRYGMEFPLITVRDMARAHEALCSSLGIDRIRVGIGGSLGGQQLLEWVAEHGERFENLCLVATNARHSAWGIAWNATQRLALEADGSLRERREGAGRAGLEAARAVAMLSYRNGAHYDATQTDTDGRIDDFRASGYQRYQGHKLAARFDAQAYWYLTKAMDSHDLGRGRESLVQTLRSISARSLLVGFTSDFLFPPDEQRFLAQHMGCARMELVETSYGHDATLMECSAITQHALDTLDMG